MHSAHLASLNSTVVLWNRNSEILQKTNGDKRINLKQRFGQFYDLSGEGASEWADAFLCPAEHVLVLRNKDGNELDVFDFTPSVHQRNGLVDLVHFDNTDKPVNFPSFDRSKFKRKVTHVKLLHPQRNLHIILKRLTNAKSFQIPRVAGSKKRLGMRYAFLSGGYIKQNERNAQFMKIVRTFLTNREIIMMKTYNGIPNMHNDPTLFGLTTPSNFLNVCWKSSYLNRNWNKCADQFKTNFCNGAPVDDLKMTLPDTDYPKARWLDTRTRCKKHAKQNHLKSICNWAANKSYSGLLGNNPIEAYCGCEKNLVTETNPHYWVSFGNNANAVDKFKEWSNIPSLNDLMIRENGQLGLNSNDVITQGPGANCWPSCNQFKSKWANEYKSQHLVDGFAQDACPMKPCINTVINNSALNVRGGIEQSCGGAGMNLTRTNGSDNSGRSKTIIIIIVMIVLCVLLGGVVVGFVLIV